MPLLETLTPNEIAKMLKLHPFTVARLAREGKIPAFKVGGVWRIDRRKFERWIAQQAPTKSTRDQHRSRHHTQHRRA